MVMVMEVIDHTTMETSMEDTRTPMVVIDISGRDPLMLNQKPKLTQKLGTATDGEAHTAMEAMDAIMEAMDMEVIHTTMVATDTEDTHTAMDIVDTGRCYHQSETTIHFDLKKSIRAYL